MFENMDMTKLNNKNEDKLNNRNNRLRSILDINTLCKTIRFTKSPTTKMRILEQTSLKRVKSSPVVITDTIF